MRAYVVQKYEKQRGNPPTFLEYAVLLYVIGKKSQFNPQFSAILFLQVL